MGLRMSLSVTKTQKNLSQPKWGVDRRKTSKKVDVTSSSKYDSGMSQDP
jgi:hypothetical protein